MTKMVPIAGFVSMLRKIVNVPLDSLMEEALVQSAQEFCRKSCIVRYEWKLTDVDTGFVYSLNDELEQGESKSLLKCSDILVVRGVAVGGSQVADLYNSDQYSLMKRDEVIFHFDYLNITAIASLEPRLGATELPEVLFDDYLDGICSGAATRLLVQPDSDWSDPNLASYHRGQFVESMREAKRFKLDSNPDDLYFRPERARSFY